MAGRAPVKPDETIVAAAKLLWRVGAPAAARRRRLRPLDLGGLAVFTMRGDFRPLMAWYHRTVLKQPLPARNDMD